MFSRILKERYAQLELTIIKEEFWSAKPRNEVQLLFDWGLSKSPQEVGYVIAFDGMRNIRTVVEVARGNAGQLDVHIPTVLRAALLCGADRFTFVHTHPSGSAVPSPSDTEVTATLSKAAAAVGLTLEDHLIVTPKLSDYFSYSAEGMYRPPAYTSGFEVSVDDKGKIIGYDPKERKTA